MVGVALAVGAGCGLVNGLLIAYGRVVPFIATLAMLASARGLAEIIADSDAPRSSPSTGFSDFFRGDFLGIPVLVWIFAAGRGRSAGSCSTARRSAGARSPSAATPRRPGWPASTSSGTRCCSTSGRLCCGIAALMLIARTTTGSSTHGRLYELDAIAAVVIGGTLLSGGRGTIVGTVFGVLIFTTLTNVFIQNNLLQLGAGGRQGR